MKSKRGPTLIGCLMLAALAVCFPAPRLSAEEWKATFSLPFQTQWAGTVLAAGDYCVIFDSVVKQKPMLLVQGSRRIAMLPILTTETPRTPAESQLLVVREGRAATVHILYVASLGMAFHFRVSHGPAGHQYGRRARVPVM